MFFLVHEFKLPSAADCAGKSGQTRHASKTRSPITRHSNFLNQEALDSLSESNGSHSEPADCAQKWEILKNARELIATNIHRSSSVPTVRTRSLRSSLTVTQSLVKEPETLEGNDELFTAPKRTTVDLQCCTFRQMR